MAKKASTISLVDTLAEFKATKKIDRTTLIGVIEESLRSVISRIFGSDENFDVIVNPDKGDLEIYRTRQVVNNGEMTDSNKQIELQEVQEIDPDYEVGEDYVQSINFADFGRRNILTLRQTLQSKILELEHDNIYNKYKDRVGELISGNIYQIWKNEILLVDDENNELHLKKDQQIPTDFYKKGDTVRCVIHNVDYRNNNPKIYVSRTDNAFLQRLLEMEIPEIFDGLITLKRIARIPGKRAKIAVESYDERIDPVGSCVGVKGTRIHGIVKELRNENIDVIPFTNNTALLVQRALSPAKVSSVEIDEERALANVYMDADQVPLAIGRDGLNIKLASQLLGLQIDVYRNDLAAEEEEDIRLEEFSDEIDQWVIDAIKAIGLDTAKAVLNAPRHLLVEKADLEENTVDDVLRILKAEFEEE